MAINTMSILRIYYRPLVRVEAVFFSVRENYVQRNI